MLPVESVGMSVSGVYASNYWYQNDQAWNQSRAAISQQFLDASELVNTAMTNAMSNQISGMATLAAQAALKRIQGSTATTAGSSTATSSTSTTANSSSAGKTSSGSSQYSYISAASILANSNVVNFFA
jgi:hypothetical protein